MFDEELYYEWLNKYDNAVMHMREVWARPRILISVSGQHPLVNGETPNEEFRHGLDLGIRIFSEKRRIHNEVYIYVPGSRYVSNGLEDKVSLSEAGCKYLIHNGVDRNHVFGSTIDKKYCGDMGVYCSTDECYTTSRLLDAIDAGELHCVCSQEQEMRIALKYIELGLIPQMHTTSSVPPHGSYIEEVFKNIPALLIGDESLDRLHRQERKPKE